MFFSVGASLRRQNPKQKRKVRLDTETKLKLQIRHPFLEGDEPYVGNKPLWSMTEGIGFLPLSVSEQSICERCSR